MRISTNRQFETDRGVRAFHNAPSAASPRVTIACSGLGRIRRGNETWARTVAEGLHRAGSNVTLLGGGPLPDAKCPYRRIANVPREFLLTRNWLSWGLRYSVEQLTAAAALLAQPTWQPGDILHIADPGLAWQMSKRTRRKGVRVVYKDGLQLGPSYCARFDFVQVLAPYYLTIAHNEGFDTRNWFVIPHLVDTRRFSPENDRIKARRLLRGHPLAPDDFVVLAVGDYSPESNKRLDWIVNEVSLLNRRSPAHLVLAGQASQTDLAIFTKQAKDLLGERVHVLSNVNTNEMPLLYASADAFAHAALHEPFGIVFLEAMASGVPVAAHHFPVTEWIVGDGGCAIDMTEPGRLAAVLESWRREPERRRAIGLSARRRAVEMFGEDEIVPLYLRMYERIAAEPLPRP